MILCPIPKMGNARKKSAVLGLRAAPGSENEPVYLRAQATLKAAPPHLSMAWNDLSKWRQLRHAGLYPISTLRKRDQSAARRKNQYRGKGFEPHASAASRAQRVRAHCCNAEKHKDVRVRVRRQHATVNPLKEDCRPFKGAF